MGEYILMCEEHNRALINGFCIECGFVLDLQSVWLKAIEPQQEIRENDSFSEEKKQLLHTRLNELEPGTALKLERLKNELNLRGWYDLVMNVTQFITERQKYYFLENPQTRGYTDTWIARD